MQNDSADPRVDQYEAAENEAKRLARLIASKTPATVLIDPKTATTETIAHFAYTLAEDLRVGRLRACRHVRQGFQPTWVFAAEPRYGMCPSCSDTRGVRLAERAHRQMRYDCDFCGVHSNVYQLRPVVMPISKFIVRGFACTRCLEL